jgi:hypothetical protein
MKITCELLGDKGVRDMVAAFSERRLAAAQATALTRVAVQVKAAERNTMARIFDRPTPYTLNSLFVRPATAQSLEATVWLKDDLAGSGTPATKYLAPQIEGGQRSLKPMEWLMQQAGHMPKGWRAVPGRGARLDAYGNMSLGQVQQILSQLRIQVSSGYTRSLPVGADRKTQAKRRRAFGRAGGQIMAFPKGRGKLPPGIYIAEGRDFGAKLGYGRNGRLTPLMIFVRQAIYRPRFEFYEVAKQVAEDQLGPQLARAIEGQVKRLTASGRGTTR